jgi:hypothetical protein
MCRRPLNNKTTRYPFSSFLPSDSAEEVVVYEEYWPQRPSHPEVAVRPDENDEGLDEHDNERSHLDERALVLEERPPADPARLQEYLGRDEYEGGNLYGAVHLLGHAHAAARGLEKAEREEHEGGTYVKHVEPVVVHEQVGRKSLLAARVVRKLVVVKTLLKIEI